MAILNKRIKEQRLQCGYTLLEVANRLGIKEATMQRYESGEIKNIKHETVLELSHIFGCTPSYLMGWEDKNGGTPKNAIEITGVVPIYGTIPAGYPAFEEAEILGYQPVMVSNPDEYFCLRVHGDSMINRGIPDGSIVLIHKQNCANNGQIAACRINRDEATLKIFTISDNTVILYPANPAYQPIIVPAEQFNTGEAEVYGVVKQIIIDL